MHRDNVLYHFSEEADIISFEPRFASPELGEVVWAISEAGMYTYLLPRDCPRVTFRADDNTSIEPIDDLLQALTDFGVELRIMPSLWPLYDAVVDSTLAFSIIRMRQSLPRDITTAREGPSPCKRFKA